MEQVLLHLKAYALLNSVIYAVLGFAIFGLTFYIMVKVCPFSVRKEIEEDQNIALAVLMGSIFVSLAVIIHAALT